MPGRDPFRGQGSEQGDSLGTRGREISFQMGTLSEQGKLYFRSGDLTFILLLPGMIENVLLTSKVL